MVYKKKNSLCVVLMIPPLTISKIIGQEIDCKGMFYIVKKQKKMRQKVCNMKKY